MQQSVTREILSGTELSTLCAARQEPDWLKELRLAALACYEEGSLPNRADHLWRYSDPASFEPAGPILDGAKAADSAALAPTLSEEARAKGVSLMTLAEAARHPEHGARVRQHLGSLLGPKSGRFEALNLASWERGLYLHVPRGVELEQALYLEFAPEESQRPFAARRVLVILEEQAAVSLVERHLDGPAPAQVNGVSEICVKDSAQLSYLLLQTLDPDTHCHLSQRVQLGRHARALASLVSLGARATKLDTGTLLTGEGGEVETIGLLYGRGHQSFDHHTVHHHSAPHTDSNLDFKAVVAGRARSAYTGNITIEKNAPFSSAYQQNRNLLLSEKARAESIPELEIKIDEVQCSHGATVGQVDREELFYLMSRGIPEKEAIRQIVSGFLETILEKVPLELQDFLRDELAARLKEI